MPPPSLTSHLPPSHPAHRQRPKSPNRVLAEADAQWLFSTAELANTPSIQDGMTPAEEAELRAKGINFIVSVGIMLKLPQITLSTAAVFFQRFLMRASLKRDRNGIPKLHHFNWAATALFLATKVEETCRKMRELVAAFCRVAQKNPNKVVDEQSKDYWRWRDCVLHHEDVLLETLCFDLTVESPHRQLFDMLKFYNLEHNKRLRNAAWAFVTDANNTSLCLLSSSRTVAIAGLYAACRFCDVQLPDDSKGRPWWETQRVRLEDVHKAVAYISDSYDPAEKKISGVAVGTGSGSDGDRSLYAGLATPSLDSGADAMRLRSDGPQLAISPFAAADTSRRASNASSVGVKRERETGAPTNGINGAEQDSAPDANKRPRLSEQARSNGAGSHDPAAPNDAKVAEERARVHDGNQRAELDAVAAEEAVGEGAARNGGAAVAAEQREANGLPGRRPSLAAGAGNGEGKDSPAAAAAATKMEEEAGSEEGEVEE